MGEQLLAIPPFIDLNFMNELKFGFAEGRLPSELKDTVLDANSYYQPH